MLMRAQSDSWNAGGETFKSGDKEGEWEPSKEDRKHQKACLERYRCNFAVCSICAPSAAWLYIPLQDEAQLMICSQHPQVAWQVWLTLPVAAVCTLCFPSCRKASLEIIGVLHKAVPSAVIEKASIDEVYIDVTNLVDDELQAS